MRPNLKKNQQLKYYQFNEICADKRFFPNKDAALKAAEIGMSNNMSLSLDVYLCETCHQWHLTSVKTKAV